MAFGAYFGVCALILVLQLCFWIRIREHASGWYLIYTMVLLTGTVLNTGYVLNSLDMDSGVSETLVGIYLCLAPLAIVRLTLTWLGLLRRPTRLTQGIEWTASGTAILTGLWVLGGGYTLGVEVAQMATSVWVLVCLVLALLEWERGDAKAGLYVAVFSFIHIALIARYARNLGWIPASVWTDYALYLGATLHVVTMSLYFIFRFSRLRDRLVVEKKARAEQQEFLGMVSHEFRTPLAIISTTIQQLSANLNAPLERTLQRVSNVRQAVQRMNSLLDDYLSSDRVDSSYQAINPQTCDFYDVIEESTAEWPINRIRIEMRDIPTRFACDTDLMRIVLRNLLANAIRHSASDSVVELKVFGRKGRLDIQVRDHGDGIPPDEVPKLFRKYFRGRAALGEPGAGLGLYLVRRIIEGHGGSISVESQPGLGTTFCIVLPSARL